MPEWRGRESLGRSQTLRPKPFKRPYQIAAAGAVAAAASGAGISTFICVGMRAMFQRPISRRPIGAAALASAAIFAILYYPPYARRRKVKDHIFLTFDDGPDPEWTPAILDALSAARSRGTFFLIGEAARQYPEIVARIASEGHAIGVHGLHHDPVTLCRASSISRELAGAQKAIMAAA